MALHRVGETLGKTRAHHRAEAGKLVRLMHGIYVDTDDSADELVRRHAVRIVRYLCPNAYLSAASAVLLGPTEDGLGELRIPVSSIRQRFLEAFRLRSEHASSFDTGMRTAIASRLLEEYRNPRGAAHATRALARENQWYREGGAAERYLMQQPVASVTRNEASLDLIIA